MKRISKAEIHLYMEDLRTNIHRMKKAMDALHGQMTEASITLKQLIKIYNELASSEVSQELIVSEYKSESWLNFFKRIYQKRTNKDQQQDGNS